MSNCINIIKISIKHKKKGFIIINNKKNISLIKEFIKIGLIKFIILKDNFIIGYINYNSDGKPIFANIINLFKNSSKKYVSIKELRKTVEKYNWVFILSTNNGLLNSYDALKKNSGGLIIAQLWN